MTQQPPPTAAQLEAECRQLVEQIARQSYSTKRLLAARSALQMILGYKNRLSRFSQGKEPP